MADKGLIEKSTLTAIADAIRAKLESSDQMLPSEMAALIESIAGNPVLQDKTVTPKKDSQTVTADDGYDGLGTVTVSGDSNLVAANIVSGKSIFNVSGKALKCACGVVTPTSNASSYDIAHGLGVTPNFAVFLTNTSQATAGIRSTTMLTSVGMPADRTYYYQSSAASAEISYLSATSTTLTVDRGSYRAVNSGWTYFWIAGVI